MSLIPSSRARIVLKVAPRIPARVVGNAGAAAAIAGGVLSVGLNYPALAANPGNVTNRTVAVLNEATGVYERLPVTALPIYAQPRTDALLNVMTLGAVGDSPALDTAAINTAVNQLNNSAIQGDLYFPPIGKPFRHTGIIRILNDSVGVRGQCPAGRNTAGSALKFENGSNDCIVFGDTNTATTSGGVTGGGVYDLRLDGTAKTGGALVRASKSADIVIQRITGRTAANGFDVFGCNNTIVRGCRVSLIAGSTQERFVLKWSGNDIVRSDGLNLDDLVLDAGGVGIPILWDGYAHSMGVTRTKMLYGLRGLWIRNTLASPGNCPQFLEAFALHADGGSGSALLVESARGLRFILPDFYNSPQDHAVQLLAGPGAYPTANIQIIGGRIGNAKFAGIYNEARGVESSNVQVTDCSQVGSGQWPAYYLAGASQRVRIAGGWAGQVDGTGANHNYGVRIDPGADYVDIDGLDCGGVVNDDVSNGSASPNITWRTLYAPSSAVRRLGPNPVLRSTAGIITLQGDQAILRTGIGDVVKATASGGLLFVPRTTPATDAEGTLSYDLTARLLKLRDNAAFRNILTT